MSARSSEKGLLALATIQARRPAGALSFLELDITSDESIEAAAQKITSDFGILDVLVNNAGIYGKEGKISRENFHTVLDTNVFGTMLLTQALQPILQKSLDPRIINVSSSLGSITLRNDHTSYYTQVTGETYRISKAALNMVTGIQSYQYSHWEHPAKVWAYCPGYVVSNLTGEEDRQNRIDQGAETSETSAQGIVEIVRGDRDDEENKFLTKRGEVYPW
jgi:NAD(P)-dependent dehydrogenase (short-subunit alcohol dehydrogenase family)